jgi:hypothetical protein
VDFESVIGGAHKGDSGNLICFEPSDSRTSVRSSKRSTALHDMTLPSTVCNLHRPFMLRCRDISNFEATDIVEVIAEHQNQAIKTKRRSLVPTLVLVAYHESLTAA